MIRVLGASLRHVLRAFMYGAIGAFLFAIAGMVYVLENRPDLHLWHKANLDEEFTVDSEVETFEDYLALEERLFAQLDELVYEPISKEAESQSDEDAADEIRGDGVQEVSRFHRWSLSDPKRWRRNWNRSYELPAESPRFGAVLLHGMSDSPYSLRHMAQRLHAEGGAVVGMRVPGHGTAPSGLLHVDWEDMAAATELAVRHVRERVGDRPLFIVGYSNGGALAVHYALSRLEDESLPEVQGLILLSPEIGVTGLAALAVWQERLGHLLGFEKLAWNSIKPEYDPFKYGSFALNAGKQAYEITLEIQALITQHAAGGALERLPPILAFQSVVDATVTAPALVTGLFDRLPGGGHELVLFDFNRFAEIEPLMKQNPAAWLEKQAGRPERSFDVTLVTNKSAKHRSVVEQHRQPGSLETERRPIGLMWPEHVYSLSHVALPFPPSDAVYGGEGAEASPGIELGNLALRGESGVLQMSAADMLRLRWNPFYPYLEARAITFIDSRLDGTGAR